MSLNNRAQRLFLSSLSGILLALPWFQWHEGWVLLFALVPLLAVDDFFFERRKEYKSVQVFWHSYFSFFIWNLLTTWWIYFATDFGAVAAIILNSAFLAVVFWLYHIVRRRLGNSRGNIALIAFWIGFEFIYLHGRISWPWLTLGNGFANTVILVQWYEYTGILGGSLWVLVSNILLFYCYKNQCFSKHKLKRWQGLTALSLLWLLPMLWSFYLYRSAQAYTKSNRGVEVVVVQPNIDPYNEKFGGMTTEDQIIRFLNLADSLVDTNTLYVVGPETAIPIPIWENTIDDYKIIELLKQFAKKHPKVTIVIGASTYRLYPKGMKTTSSRLMRGSEQYYDSFNTALAISLCDSIQIYHKSKLVIGVEEIPYQNYFKPLGKLAINLGGSMSSLGTQKERTVFATYDDTLKVAPIICYESIYGDFVTGYVRNGAHFLMVITNDGWWRDTPGYKQHFSFSQLRAVETRRYLVRSANTGISGIISPQGEVLQKTKWWRETAIKAMVYPVAVETFYVHYGDYLGTMAVYLSLFILIMLLVYTAKKRIS